MGEKIWIPGDPVPTGRDYLNERPRPTMALAEGDMRDHMIHVLHAGLPLCGFTRLVPRDWPPGHLFVTIEKAGAATCSKCDRLAAELVEERRELKRETNDDERQQVE